MSFTFLSSHWLFSCRWFQFPLHWTASEVTLSSLALVLLSMSRTELTHSRLDFDLGMLTQNEQAWTHFQSIDSSLNSFFFLSLYILCPRHPALPPNHHFCFPISPVASCLHLCSVPQVSDSIPNCAINVPELIDCCCSVAQSFLTLCDPMDCSTPGFPVLHYLPEFAQSHIHRVGDAIQPSHSLSLLLFLPSVFPSIRVFPNEMALCIRWPKDWNFSISPSKDYSGLISFRTDLDHQNR